MQYKFVMFMSWLICHLPYRLTMAMGWLLGNLYYLLIKKERERAEETELPASVERKTAQELFEDFYEQVRGQKMDEEHRQVIDQVVKEIS